MFTVHHGGTAATSDFKRSYAAKNSGSIGYYVTTNRTQAAAYGDVHSYIFKPNASMDDAKLSFDEAKALSNLTEYWSNYSDDPNTMDAVNVLVSLSVTDAMLEVINSTGCIDETINYLISLGFSHYTVTQTEDVSVYVVIDVSRLVQPKTATEKLMMLSSNLEDADFLEKFSEDFNQYRKAHKKTF